jgi:hypothetical protein
LHAQRQLRWEPLDWISFVMDGSNWTIEKNPLLLPVEQEGALKHFQENVLHPVLNSVAVEPWNALVSSVNGSSEFLHGPKLLPRAEDFRVGESPFLSGSWFIQSIAGGLGLLLPYTLVGKAAGGVCKGLGSAFNASGRTMLFLENEATTQILGAATYDGLRERSEGETHLGNALGGITAFGSFAIGNALSKDLPIKSMLAIRTLAGAIGGTAQHAVATYWSGAAQPSLEQLGQSTVNGIVMSLVLPEAQRMLHSSLKNGGEHLTNSAPLERYFEIKPELPGEAVSHNTANGGMHEAAVEHMGSGPASYDFFVKVEGTGKSREANGDNAQNLLVNRRPTRQFELPDYTLSTSLAESVATAEKKFLASVNLPADQYLTFPPLIGMP